MTFAFYFGYYTIFIGEAHCKLGHEFTVGGGNLVYLLKEATSIIEVVVHHVEEELGLLLL